MKISIYVPDELAVRLAVVKDDLNVSEVCQAALAAAVTAAEAARLGDERPRIIERLRRSRTADEQLFERGLADGRHWAAEDAALTELRAVIAAVEGDRALSRLGLMRDVPLMKQPMYASAFRQGALEVWEHVRTEFEE